MSVNYLNKTIEYSTSFERDKKKISKSVKVSLIDETIDTFINEPNNHTIRLHKISCKHDKNRYSISVPNTQYRILLTLNDDLIIFLRVMNHKKYDLINKNC